MGLVNLSEWHLDYMSEMTAIAAFWIVIRTVLIEPVIAEFNVIGFNFILRCHSQIIRICASGSTSAAIADTGYIFQHLPFVVNQLVNALHS